MEYIKNKKVNTNEIAVFIVMVIVLAIPAWILLLLID